MMTILVPPRKITRLTRLWVEFRSPCILSLAIIVLSRTEKTPVLDNDTTGQETAEEPNPRERIGGNCDNHVCFFSYELNKQQNIIKKLHINNIIPPPLQHVQYVL